MSVRINKSQPTEGTPQGQGDQPGYEKLSVPVSITLPIAQVPAENPNQPAQPTNEAPSQPPRSEPAEPSS